MSIRVWMMSTLFLLVACEKAPPEEAILAHIKAMQQAIEARQAGGVLDFIADDFHGSHGLDKEGLRRLLIAQFLRHGHVNMLITNMDVSVGVTVGDKASIKGVVLLTGSDHNIPQEGRLYKITGEWQLRKGNWLLVSLQWE